MSRPRKQQPTELGLRSLEPKPMSPADVADLVERSRTQIRVATPGIRAAVLAFDTGMSISNAARAVGCAHSTVGCAWRKLYPGIPVRVNRRPR